VGEGVGVGEGGVGCSGEGTVEGSGRWGQERPGRVPGGTSMAGGVGWVGQWAASQNSVFQEHTKDGGVVCAGEGPGSGEGCPWWSNSSGQKGSSDQAKRRGWEGRVWAGR